MKHLSRLDIEAIAEKYITAYMELPEVQDMPVYRIEPELFLERVLGLKIDYAHLSYDGTLLGMTSFVEVMVDVMTAEFEEEHKPNNDISAYQVKCVSQRSCRRAVPHIEKEL